MALLDFTDAPHGGRQRHLPEWQSQPKITPTTIIDHSIVGTGAAAFGLFRDRSVLESHFIVCGAGDLVDGEIWQLMDTARQADANLDANGYAISIETGDQGDPDHQLWTQAQLRSLIWLHAQLRRVHPTIPNRRSRSCADPAGHGFHTMHGAPSCWTPVAKTCPGTVRKRQWEDVLLPAYLAGATTEEDTVSVQDVITALKDPDAVKALRKAIWGGTGEEIPSVAGTLNAAQTVEVAANGVRTLANTLGPVATNVEALVSREVVVRLDLLNASPDQVQALGKAIADHLEIRGHPTMTGTGTWSIQLGAEASAPPPEP